MKVLIESSKDAPVESLSFSPDNSCLAAAVGANFCGWFLHQQRCQEFLTVFSH